jgi:hypothetical protein
MPLKRVCGVTGGSSQESASSGDTSRTSGHKQTHGATDAETPADSSYKTRRITDGRTPWLNDAATKGRVAVTVGGKESGYETRWMTPLAAKCIKNELRRIQAAARGI